MLQGLRSNHVVKKCFRSSAFQQQYQRRWSYSTNTHDQSVKEQLTALVDRINIFGNGKAGAIIPDATCHNLAERYEIGKEIGIGRYGEVSKAIKRGTNELYAVKSIQKNHLSSSMDIQREVSILRMLDNPHTLKLIDICEDDKAIHLVSNYCSGGELFDRIISAGVFSEYDAAMYLKQILEALRYLHNDLHVAHRDIKPENLLIVDPHSHVLCLCDFGMSISFSPGRLMRECCGSPTYVAPEVLLKRYTEKADMWSAGVILYIFLCGRVPFAGNTSEAIMEQVSVGEYSMTGPEWNVISDSAKDLVRKLLEVNPEIRYSADQALEHPWIQDCGDNNYRPLSHALSNMEKYTCQERIKKTALHVIADYLIQNTRQHDTQVLVNLFKSLDPDNTGYVPAHTLSQKYVEECNNKGGMSTLQLFSVDEVARILEDADLDGNGMIDLSEFIAATLPRNFLQNEPEKFARVAFAHFDRENKGYINMQDLKDSCIDDNQKNLESYMQKYDLNKDGKIDFSEFEFLLRKN